jgi:predicted dehydrogenase
MSNRYVLAGVGNRGLGFFGRRLLANYRDHCRLVGLFDLSRQRLQAANHRLGTHLPTYTNFQQMLAEADPDGVIIATSDVSHETYIVQTLRAGKRVVSEKPLCIDAGQVRSILAAYRLADPFSRETSLATHNMRYSPHMQRIKETIDAGEIGSILTVTMHEYLDRKHGADYFRRWHKFKKNSGGLLLQKGSHLFDIINWLVGSTPKQVVAQGGLYHYGKNGPFRSQRCTGCAHAQHCDYYFDLNQNEFFSIYRDSEADSGYLRDACLYDNRIDIEDQMGVLYNYANGVEVVFSMTAFASFEGLRLEIQGTEGKLEYELIGSASWAPGQVEVPGLVDQSNVRLRLFSYRDGIREIDLGDKRAGHAHYDDQMLDDIFVRPLGSPFTGQQATLDQAAWAALIGIAANLSIAAASTPVTIADLFEPVPLWEFA